MKTENKKTYSQIVAVISVIASIGAIFSLYWTFNIKDNYRLTEILTAVLIALFGGIVAMLGAYLAKLIIKRKNEKIFIIYSHKDIDFVDKLKNDLRSLRYVAFIDSDVLKVGDNINSVINQTIDKSDMILFVLSENSVKSSSIKYELEKALSSKKKTLPLVVDKNVKIPTELEGVLYADFTQGYTNSLKGLIDGIEKTKK